MGSRAFLGQTMTRPPVRLSDRAWTEVAVDCPQLLRVGETVAWADGRAHDKGCRGNERIWHVRCEFSDGNWSDKCRDMESRAFRGLPMTRPPIRLSDRAWTEVAVACR